MIGGPRRTTRIFFPMKRDSAFDQASHPACRLRSCVYQMKKRSEEVVPFIPGTRLSRSDSDQRRRRYLGRSDCVRGSTFPIVVQNIEAMQGAFESVD